MHKAALATGPLSAYCGGRGGGPHVWNVHRRGSCEGWLRERKHASSVLGPLAEGGASSQDLKVDSPKTVFTGHQEGPHLPWGQAHSVPITSVPLVKRRAWAEPSPCYLQGSGTGAVM